MLYKQFPIFIQNKSPMSLILNQAQGQSDSFNASVEIKSNRKNRRKIKKIIHNCCVYVKKADGSYQIILKQFLVSCRLKTSKCLAKKAQEIQTQKDREVFQQLLGKTKSATNFKQITNYVESQQDQSPEVQNDEKCAFVTEQKFDGHYQMPAIYYILPTTFSFQMI